LRDEDVISLFRELDRRHYARRLISAGCRVTFGHVTALAHFLGSSEDVAGWYIPESHLILLEKDGDHPDGLRATLLHEMAHASVDLDRPLSNRESPHGSRFMRELGRLYYAGESCLEHQWFGPQGKQGAEDRLARSVNRLREAGRVVGGKG
jgi:hypothetical protein